MSEQTVDLLGDCLEKFRYLMYLPEDYDQTLLHEVDVFLIITNQFRI